MTDQPKILIIEEDRSTRDALQFSFISRGWEVAMGASEGEALWILGDFAPDWVIVGWQQLHGTGNDFFRNVRAKARGARVAVLTDELTSTERAMLSRLKPDIAVPKPVVPEAVFRMCVRHDARFATAG
jgi:DNA-binding response OmpR family regulator